MTGDSNGGSVPWKQPFEIHAELDDGWRLTTDGKAEDWQGARIRYRPLGSKGRYRSFLLEYDEQPSIQQLQAVCERHADGL